MSENSLTYVGISASATGCAVISVLARQDSPGSYVVAKELVNPFMSYNVIVEEIEAAVALRTIPQEDLASQEGETSTKYNMSINELRRYGQEAYKHFFSIIHFEDITLTKRIAEMEFKQPLYQKIFAKASQPKADLDVSLKVACALINDGLVVSDEFDFALIKQEIEHPDFTSVNASHRLTALALSLGEAEVRRSSGTEDLPIDYTKFNENLRTLYSAYTRSRF
jgi:hypothetical protein